MATTLASVVNFTTSIVLLTRSGSTFLVACGTMMYAIVCSHDSPVDRAASDWPRAMLSIPARKISQEESKCHGDNRGDIDAKKWKTEI